MANIRTVLSTLLGPGFAKETGQVSVPVEGRPDRIDHDLIGLSDADAMWYYERRNWRGRD